MKTMFKYLLMITVLFSSGSCTDYEMITPEVDQLTSFAKIGSFDGVELKAVIKMKGNIPFLDFNLPSESEYSFRNDSYIHVLLDNNFVFSFHQNLEGNIKYLRDHLVRDISDLREIKIKKVVLYTDKGIVTLTELEPDSLISLIKASGL